MKKYMSSKWQLKKSISSYSYIRKRDIKLKIAQRDKEDHFIMIKMSIHQEDIIIVNIYALNIGAPKYIKQKLTELKGKINSNAIIVKTLLLMHRSSRQ